MVSGNDGYVPLFDGLKDEPFDNIRAGARVWFLCHSQTIQGTLRHLSRGDRHFGLNDRKGQNLGHFGWKKLPGGGVWIYRKTGDPQPLPNRRLELIARFIDLDDPDEEETQFFRTFFDWLTENNYRICRSDGDRLDTEALLVEYQSR